MATTSKPTPFEGGVSFDWQNYIKYRPTYSTPFYNLIWDYHRRHSNRWQLAHDVATGPGIVAIVLAELFSKVIASDPSPYHVAVAKSAITASNVTVEQCRAEDLDSLDQIAQGNVDLITLAEAIPLVDAKQAFLQFAKLLRPGGTLAIWFHGGPIFIGQGQENSQRIYDEIIGKMFAERTLPWGGTPMERACRVLESWTDNIAFPPESWEDVQRTKWNADRPLNFFNKSFLDFEATYVKAIRDEEKVEEVADRDLWRVDGCDLDWIKGYAEVQFPWSRKMSDEGQREIDGLFEQLEVAMGGHGSQTSIGWPVVLMLATKK